MSTYVRKLVLREIGFDTDDSVPDTDDPTSREYTDDDGTFTDQNADAGEQIDPTEDKLMDGFQDLLQEIQDDLRDAASMSGASQKAGAESAIQRCAFRLEEAEAAIKSGEFELARTDMMTYVGCVLESYKIPGIVRIA